MSEKPKGLLRCRGQGRGVFKCDICDKLFQQKGKLELHIIIVHKQKNPHECSMCGNSYRQRHQLKYHVKTVHDGMFKFQCDPCEKSYVIKVKRWCEVGWGGRFKCEIQHDETKPHQCQICKEKFFYKKGLNQHISSVHDGVSFDCNICLRKYKTKPGLTFHMALAHEGKTKKSYNCELCDKSYPLKLYLTRHIENCHEKREKLQCLTCSKTFYQESKLKNHMRVNHYGKFKCKLCGKRFPAEEKLSKHKNKFHDEKKPYKCDECGHTFVDKFSLNVHFTSIHEGIKFDCGICQKKLASKQALKKHINSVHEGEMSYRCSFCDNGYSLQNELKIHVDSVHEIITQNYIPLNENLYTIETLNEELLPTESEETQLVSSTVANIQAIQITNFNANLEKDVVHSILPSDEMPETNALKGHIDIIHESKMPLKCSSCNESFPSQCDLETHTDSVHEKMDPQMKNNVCEVCDSSFESKHDLDIHIEVTHKVKNPYICNSFNKFKCEICEKHFKSEEKLSRHNNKFHDETKPYRCDICGNTFCAKDNLKFHIKSIHKENKCNFCSKSFSVPVQLMRHIEFIHKFKCEICEKQFQSEEKLSRHNNKFHDETKPYRCDICGNTFCAKDNLKFHIKSIHKEKIFPCKICHENFTSKWVMNKHIRSVHQKEELIQDNQLNEIINVELANDFSNYAKDQGVKEIQSNPKIIEKPNQCPICDQNFIDSNEMKNHITLEHESILSSENVDSHDINYIISNFIDECVCMICDHICKNKVEIIDHVKKEHLAIISQEDFDKTLGTETSETQPDEEPISVSFIDIESSLYPKGRIPQTVEKIKQDKGAVHAKDLPLLNSFKVEYSDDGPLEKFKEEMTMQNNLVEKEKTQFDKQKRQPESFTTETLPMICLEEVKSDLKTNIEIVHDKKFKCDVCFRSYDVEEKLSRHIATAHDITKPFQCGQCGVTFCGKGDLNRHIDTTHYKISYSCDFCPKKYTQKGPLRNHINKVHLKDKSTNDEKFKCEFCEKSYILQAKLDLHITIVHEQKNPHKCTICNKSYKHRHQLKYHVKTDHNGKFKFECIHGCGKSYELKEKLDKHIAVAHDETKPYQCHICRVTLCGKGELNLHIRTIHEGIYFYCKICHRTFSQKGALKAHINRIHQKETQFKIEVSSECFEMEGNGFSLDIAEQNQLANNSYEHEQISLAESNSGIPKTNAEFSRMSSQEFFDDSKTQLNSETQVEPIYLSEDPLGDDMGTVHEDEKSYKCTFCGKCFSSDEKLSRHIATAHDVTKPFQCGHCGVTFCGKGDLNRHIDSIHNKISYSCDFCQKEFSYKGTLRTHINIVHQKDELTFDDKFKCELCDKSYIVEAKLDLHFTKVHEQKNPQTCSICNKSYKYRHQLNYHVKTDHKGRSKKPYQCHICRVTFCGKSELNRHIGSIHEGISFDCKICNRTFSQKCHLKTHIDRIHQKAISFKIEVSSENCEMEGNDPITEQISPDMAEQNQSENNLFEHKQISKAESYAGIPKTNTELSRFSTQDRKTRLTSETQVEQIHLSEDPLDMGTVQEEENSNKCTFCGKCFSSDEALVKHVASFICH